MAEKHKKHTANNQLMSQKAGQRWGPRKNDSTKRKSERNVERQAN